MELVVPVAPDGGRARPISTRVANLNEKVVGLWYNNWSSYDVFLGHLEQLLGAGKQASHVTKRIPELPRHAMRTRAEIDAIAAPLDTAIVGLGA